MSDSLAKRYGIGCGDNSCVWGSRGGMATNGGCRCHDKAEVLTVEQTEERRKLHAGIRLLRSLAEDPRIGAALDQLVLAVRAKDARS